MAVTFRAPSSTNCASHARGSLLTFGQELSPSFMPWKCATCGVEHDDLPTCFGCEAPWRELVAESEFESRVELTRDQCVVDGSVFFVRGHLEIPIVGHPETLVLAVWSSLSEQSFCHMCDRWNDDDRHYDPPYFGWLSSRLPVYPDTVNLKLSVQTNL